MFSENRKILNQLFTSASAEKLNFVANTISVSVSDALVCTERERASIAVFHCFSQQFPNATTGDISVKAIQFTSQREKLIKESSGEVRSSGEVSCDVDVSSSASQLDRSGLSENLSDTGNTEVLISMILMWLQYITCYTQGYI